MKIVKAQAGDKIIITSKINYLDSDYKVGDILTVNYRVDDEVVDTSGGFFIYDEEYKLWEEEE